MMRFRSKKVRNQKHLNRVRQLPCLVCSSPPQNHAHHIQFAEQRGFGQKVGDQWVVPLCAVCHHKLHTAKEGEKLFWVFEGVDGLKVAEDLWRQTNETDDKHKDL